MHLLRALVVSLLPLAVLGAKKPAADTFERFRTKALTSTPIKLDDSSYDKLTSIPRDYSVAILLTAMDPRFGCQLCRDFQPEWDLASKSWINGDKKGASRLLYGNLDFMDGKGTFQSLGLQTAPVVLFFHPTTGPHAVADTSPLRLDFTSGPQSAESIHAFVSRHMPDRPHPSFSRPVNWVLWIAVTTSMLGGLTVLRIVWPYLLPLIQNRNLWAAISLILILLFTSGHMFNHIRKVPYVAGNGHGGVSYIAGGFSNQYGMETQIIAAIYGLLSFSTIALALRVPRISDPRIQQVTVLIWAGAIFFMYGFLLSIFRMKNGGYPFWLPPFS